MLKFVSRSQLHCYSLIKQSTMTFYSNSELVNSLKGKAMKGNAMNQHSHVYREENYKD